MKIIIAPSSFAAEDSTPLRVLQSAGLEVIPNPVGRRWTEKETIEFLDGVDGLIAGLEPLNRLVLTTAKGRLKALARVGIGMTNVDQKAAAEFGIKVSSTPGAPSEAVAEMTLTALLALLREIVPMNEALHAKNWKKLMGRSVREIVLLIVGYGRIGRRFASLARSLGARIHVYDPYLATAQEEGVEVIHSDLQAALAVADVVSFHASGDQPVFQQDHLAYLKPGVIFLNSARGELVEEAALEAGLDSGIISKAWFDAFWTEPYQGTLGRFPQFLMTPHAATYTRWCRLHMETEAAENLVRDLGLARQS